MGRRPATIRDANEAKACANTAARRRGLLRSFSIFAVLLLAGAPILRAQATLGTTTGDSSALTINSNNSPSLAYNAVLNSDSSVSLLEDGAILPQQGCPAFSGLSSGINSGAVYVDFANSNIYLTMTAGTAVYAAYESINQEGNCTQGPLLELTTNALSNLEMNIDPAQGSVYILNSFGAFPDTLYILPIGPWSASSLPTPAQVDLDYSAQYGPIVIDPSNHLVYVNDLGDSTAGTIGTYSTAGFFVYDPNQSTTPTNNLQHVVGYNTGGTTTVLNVGTLLDNGAGKLVLVNENPNASTVNLTVPITILDTTQFSFFTGTTKPFTNNNDVDITPGAGLSTISATAQYEAIGGADIDVVNQVVYADAFNIPNSTQPGTLLEYNLSSTSSPQETVLSSATAKPNLYGSLAPWSGLNYNPESTELVLSVASEYGSGALGLTSPLCAGTPLALTQLFGSAVAPTSLGYSVVNATSGYVYAIQSGNIDYVAPPSGCSSIPTYTIGGSVSGLASGTSVTLLDNGGDSVTVTYPATSFTFPTALDSGANYAVTVGTQPAGETCTVTNGSGQVAASNVANVSVACQASAATYTIGGSVSGLTSGTSVTLLDNGGDSVTVTYPATSFTFPTALDSGASYAVTVGTQPTGENCTVTSGSGQVATSNIANVSVTCGSSGPAPAQVTDNEIITVSDTETLPDVVDSEPITVTDIDTVTTGPIITGPGSLAAGTLNVAYPTTTLSAIGGLPPYNWTTTGMPPGLTIGPTTGVISGTPTIAGVYFVTVTVTDSAGLTFSANFSLAVTASAPIANVSPASLTFTEQPSSTQSAAQTVTLSNTGNAPLSITGTGISISGTNATDFSQTNSCGTNVAAGSHCVISVTFTPSLLSPGTYTATLNAVDNANGSPQQVPLTGVVTASAPLAITGPGSLPAGTVNVMYPTTTLSANGGLPPYTWSATGLPPGLSISASGVISGTPTISAGSPFAVTVTVTDGALNTGSTTYSLIVDATLTITSPASLLTGILNVMYPNTTITASGGTPPYNWRATGLPPGLSISASGVISGTPTTQAGSPYAVTVTATDSAGNTASADFSLTVTAGAPSVSFTIPTINLSGDSGTVQITSTATDFTGTIALSCNLPATLSAYVTCSFSPNSLVFTSTNTQANTTLSIQPVQAASVDRTSRPWPLPSGEMAFGAVLWLPAWAFAMRRKKERSKRGLLLLIILLCGSPLVTSCGGKSKGPAMAPAGTYQASIVLAGPGINETITFTIQVP
jgi:hypothetical protein